MQAQGNCIPYDPYHRQIQVGDKLQPIEGILLEVDAIQARERGRLNLPHVADTEILLCIY